MFDAFAFTLSRQ